MEYRNARAGGNWARTLGNEWATERGTQNPHANSPHILRYLLNGTSAGRDFKEPSGKVKYLNRDFFLQLPQCLGHQVWGSGLPKLKGFGKHFGVFIEIPKGPQPWCKYDVPGLKHTA